MEIPFLTVNVKFQKSEKIKYKIVNKNWLKIIEFPEEELIQKSRVIHNCESTKPTRKRKINFNKKTNILRKKLQKRKVLNAIQTAVDNYTHFPLNQAEYVQLLWDVIDEIEDEIKYLIPIINCSTHNNLMRCLYMILAENNKNLIKLIEYEVEPISKFHFEQVCVSLMDNLVSCNRVLLGCCYAQNCYQKVNKPLIDLIALIDHFETIVAFVSTAILQSGGCVKNYIPSGHVIRHLKCSICDAVVTLAGCYCTNWALDTLSAKQAELFANPVEDGPATSSTHSIMSWDVALYYLRNMPPPEEHRPPLKFTKEQKTRFEETSLIIKDGNEKRQPKPKKRKAVDTIDEVWLKNKITCIIDELCESQDKPEFKRKAGNNAWLIDELYDILDNIPSRKSKSHTLKRKAEESVEDLCLLNQVCKNVDLSFDELLDEMDVLAKESESSYSESSNSESSNSESKSKN